MIKKILKFLSGKNKSTESSHKMNLTGDSDLNDIISFVDYVVRALVDNPSNVKIELAEKEKNQIINIFCDQTDIGKIIGRNGKTIMAIRSLVTGAASRLNKQVTVEVID